MLETLSALRHVRGVRANGCGAFHDSYSMLYIDQQQGGVTESEVRRKAENYYRRIDLSP